MKEVSIKKAMGILSLGGLLVVSGCGASAQQTFKSSSPVSVEVSGVQEGLIGNGKVYAGTVTPSEEVKIMSKIPGKVVDMPVEVGTKVKAGQVLLKLEDKDLQNSLDKANAAVAAAEANVESAKTAREASIAQADTGVVQSKSGMVQSKSGMVQSKNGIVQSKNGMVQSKGGMVQSKSGIIQSENAMVQAQDNITKAQSAVIQAEDGVKDNAITLKKAEQALKDAKTNHDRMKGLFEESLVSKVQLEQAETALVNAQAAYDSAKVASHTVQNKLETAKKAFTAAQEAYANAKEAYTNAKEAYTNAQEGFANAQEGYTNAQEVYETAKEGYDTASEGYASAQKQAEIAKSESGIKASEQMLKQAQVNVKAAKDALDDAIVTSPINGVIGAKYAEKGEMISNQAPVLVLANFDKVKVLTYIPTSEINEIEQGSQVQVNAIDFDFTTKGVVKTISPFDEKGKGYPVEVEVPNPNFKFKAGMIVDLRLIPKGAEQGILVPVKALEREKGKAYVYVVRGDKVSRREVKIGKREGSFIMVKEGLSENDMIVTSNLALLSDSATISYRKE
ncbi:efflux RND transporter periplasmic adaptor subunit [Bacillus songklensis]|uniref:Efflux RND transporter periplasmic adaptor subunit n=1 Tax=Bacillus songklensis TaxID=1069116 RepID=A0ABV8B2S7_9BACI